MLGRQLGLERALHNGGAGANIATLAYAVGVVILFGRERELLAPNERRFGRDFRRYLIFTLMPPLRLRSDNVKNSNQFQVVTFRLQVFTGRARVEKCYLFMLKTLMPFGSSEVLFLRVAKPPP